MLALKLQLAFYLFVLIANYWNGLSVSELMIALSLSLSLSQIFFRAASECTSV